MDKMKISMTVQRSNVQCIQEAYGKSAFEELDEIVYKCTTKEYFLNSL